MNRNLPSSLKSKSTITRKRKPKTLAYVGAPLKPAKAKSFRINIRSRHPSHSPLKKEAIRLPFRTVVRFGSSWVGDGKPRIEINSVDAITTSANKRLMKKAFSAHGVRTANWSIGDTNSLNAFVQLSGFPIVAKHIHGSRGTGNYLLNTQAELTSWLQGKTLTNYIFEQFHDYNREYRLHVTKNGCFYTCRKMLKSDTPEDKRWFRNDSNSVWVLESNPQFDKPVNWNTIVAESVKALAAVGLDIGAIDVRVQGAKNSEGAMRTDPKFIILETNSAPSFGDITLQKYTEIIPQLLIEKRNASRTARA